MGQIYFGDQAGKWVRFKSALTANGTETAESDWDFIAEGDSSTLSFLRAATHFHRDNIDFLVVTNGDKFTSAWGAKKKSGSLSSWKWQECSTGSSATYTQVKWIEREDGSDFEQSRKKALLAWEKSRDSL